MADKVAVGFVGVGVDRWLLNRRAAKAVCPALLDTHVCIVGGIACLCAAFEGLVEVVNLRD